MNLNNIATNKIVDTNDLSDTNLSDADLLDTEMGYIVLFIFDYGDNVTEFILCANSLYYACKDLISHIQCGKAPRSYRGADGMFIACKNMNQLIYNAFIDVVVPLSNCCTPSNDILKINETDDMLGQLEILKNKIKHLEDTERLIFGINFLIETINNNTLFDSEIDDENLSYGLCDTDNSAYLCYDDVPNDIKYLLKLHFPVIYRGMGKYECDECGLKCKSGVALENHECYEQIRDDILYSCSKCDSEFASLKDVNIHETYYCAGFDESLE